MCVFFIVSENEALINYIYDSARSVKFNQLLQLVGEIADFIGCMG